MTPFELRPTTSPTQVPEARELIWPVAPRSAGALRTDLDPWLTSLGPVPIRATDLVRFATGAYLADQLKARPQSFSRSFDLRVQLVDPDAWPGPVLDDLADLLSSLTADDWQLESLRDTTEPRPVASEDKAWKEATRVALLSGGLDSFAGAAISSAEPGVLYLGHWDQPAVKSAQNAVKAWFAASGRPIDYVQLLHGLRDDKAEGTTRSRSLLFMALAVALAAARGAAIVEVPENGYTSLNPPLGPERGGALSTRSTHPWTIARFNRLLEALGIDVRVRNPHEDLTKGELVRLAVAASPGDFGVGAAKTLSCAKLNGHWYKGGNPNYHCGLCVACIVRRASLIVGGVPDQTSYLFETLVGDAQADIVRHRGRDIDAVRLAIVTGLDDIDLMALGPFPDDFDLDAGLALCRRALEEIARVPLG